MNTSTTYFVIHSRSSRNSMAGLCPQAMLASNKSIVEAAASEMIRSGESLEEMAGIEWIEDADGNMHPARKLTYDEVLALSIEKLGADGRLFAAFSTDEEGAESFVKTAEYYGVGDEARAIIEKFNS